ncbi:MAG: acyl-CoA thioesterase [Bacillota bacterium]
MTEHTHRLRVTYRDTDKMGVVYYANYLHWFEVGRTEYFRESGITYQDLERQGIFLPVLEANCNYHQPARYDDQIQIKTRITRLKRIKLWFEYQIERVSDGELLATGSTEHSFVNSDFEPLILKREAPEMWQIIKSHFDK